MVTKWKFLKEGCIISMLALAYHQHLSLLLLIDLNKKLTFLCHTTQATTAVVNSS